jgi:hypothetical protein
MFGGQLSGRLQSFSGLQITVISFVYYSNLPELILLLSGIKIVIAFIRLK